MRIASDLLAAEGNIFLAFCAKRHLLHLWQVSGQETARTMAVLPFQLGVLLIVASLALDALTNVVM